MQIATAGDRALLVTLSGASSARLRAASVALRGVPGVVAAIVGHESLYVIGSTDRTAVTRAIDDAQNTPVSEGTHHRIGVSFADEHALDLREFLAAAHLSREEFLRRLVDVRLSVRYLGFRAGFAYLDGWPEEWRMPRRPTSRNLVPGGSFGIAGAMAGFYPVDSPGGWNILGRTHARLWDPSREPPNLLAAGDEIALIPSRPSTTLGAGSDGEGPAAQDRRGSLAPLGTSAADVIAPGQLTTIVGARDWNRVQYGLTPGGPFDDEMAAAANNAVGNRDDAPLLECVLVGPRLRFRRDARVAWCDRELREWNASAGEEIEIGRVRGMRGYLAIAGGIDEMRARYAEEPTVLKKGDALWSAGNPAGAPHRRDHLRSTEGRLTLQIVRGPHEAPPLPEEWEVTPHLNRVGIRLRPLQAIDAKPPADLPSCGMRFGTLQWHPDGSVLAMGPDHPVTGGYLQPATLLSTELWKLAQLQPGDRVRIVHTFG
jgi:KipI family sensor histidine kinase inhibitor